MDRLLIIQPSRWTVDMLWYLQDVRREVEAVANDSSGWSEWKKNTKKTGFSQVSWVRSVVSILQIYL